MQISRFWFFPHDALQTVSNTACPMPLSFWILMDLIISEQFEQVKHQFVWPDMLLKRLIDKTNGHQKRLLKYNFELFQGFFFGIEVHVVLKEVYVYYGTQGNHLHAQPFKSRCAFKFYCLKKIICFLEPVMTSQWQMLFLDIFNDLQTERFINKRCKIQNDDMYWNGYVLFSSSSSSSSSSSLFNHRISFIKMLFQGAVQKSCNKITWF